MRVAPEHGRIIAKADLTEEIEHLARLLRAWPSLGHRRSLEQEVPDPPNRVDR